LGCCAIFATVLLQSDPQLGNALHGNVTPRVLTYVILGMSLYVACGNILYRGYIRKKRRMKKVNIVAWQGWEESALYPGDRGRAFWLSKELLDFLVYNRGLSNLPLLFSVEEGRKHTFDVMVVDAEYLPNYYKEPSRLYDLSDRNVCTSNGHPLFPSCWNTQAPFIRHLYDPILRPEGQRLYGVPIRFGFQEPLLNERMASRLLRKCGKDSLCYRDIAPLEVARGDPTVKLIFWDWHLPSLSVLLLTAGVPLEQVTACGEKEIEEILGPLTTDPKICRRCVFLDTLEEIERQIHSGIDMIIYGVPGSSFLGTRPHSRSAPDSQRIVPVRSKKEGVFVWCEVAALQAGNAHNGSVLHDPKPRPEAVDVLKHWLSAETQMHLANQKPLASLTPAQGTLRQLLQQQEWPENLRTLLEIVDQHDLELLPDAKVQPRMMPEDPVLAQEWIDCWSKFRRAAHAP
jgi:hypothetical protein